MTNKQTKQTNKASKQAKQTKAKQSKSLSFAEYKKQGLDDLQALKKTKAERKALQSNILKDKLADIESFANRMGQGGFILDKNNLPLKSDLQKICIIKSEWGKGACNISARALTGLCFAFLLADSKEGFARIFKNGLYLENGILQRMQALDLIKAGKADSACKQYFTFTDKAKKYLQDKALQNILA